MQALVCGAAECSIQASSTMSERGVAVLGEPLPKNDQKDEISPINKVTRNRRSLGERAGLGWGEQLAPSPLPCPSDVLASERSL